MTNFERGDDNVGFGVVCYLAYFAMTVFAFALIALLVAAIRFTPGEWLRIAWILVVRRWLGTAPPRGG